MADFQSFSYPTPLSNSPEKEIFNGYGSHGHMNLCDSNNRKFSAQTLPYPDLIPEFHAIHPSLPLCSTPVKVNYPFQDRIMKEVTRRSQCVKEFVGKLKYFSRLIRKQGTLKEREIQRINTILEIQRHANITSDAFPKWFGDLCDLYSQVYDVKALTKVNSLYNGGCVTHLTGPDLTADVLVSATGSSFQNLRVSTVTIESGILQTDRENFIPIRDTIYQVSSQCHGSQGYVGVRTSHGCHLYKLSEPDSSERSDSPIATPDRENEAQRVSAPPGLALVAKTTIDNETPTAFTLSPYIECESITATDLGNVYLWHADLSIDQIIQEKCHRFECCETWRGVHYGAHPRQIIMADNTVVEMSDLRSTQIKDVDLFTLPSKLLGPAERVRGAKQHPVCSFQHIVMTDHSLLLIDERFPGHPLLYMPHMLRTPPQYLSTVLPFSGDADLVLLLASQSPPETCCLWTQSNLGKLPQAIGPPWRISRIDDFTKWDEMITTSDRLLFKERFDVSLAGMTALSHPHGFTVFQMDSHGEIFEQSYMCGAREQDRTFSAGPGSLDLVPDMLAIKTGKHWLESLKRRVDKGCLESSTFYKTMKKDLEWSFDGMVIEKPAHVLCTLCMPQYSEYCPPEEDSHTDDLCHSCQHTLSIATTVTVSADHDSVISLDEASDFLDSLLPSKSEFSNNDVTSQLLLKLWHGETDLNDLLIKQEEERGAKKSQQKSKNSDPLSLDLSGGSDGSDDNQLLSSNSTDLKSVYLQDSNTPLKRVKPVSDNMSVISGSVSEDSITAIPAMRICDKNYSRSMELRDSGLTVDQFQLSNREINVRRTLSTFKMCGQESVHLKEKHLSSLPHSISPNHKTKQNVLPLSQLERSDLQKDLQKTTLSEQTYVSCGEQGISSNQSRDTSQKQPNTNYTVTRSVSQTKSSSEDLESKLINEFPEKVVAGCHDFLTGKHKNSETRNFEAEDEKELDDIEKNLFSPDQFDYFFSPSKSKRASPSKVGMKTESILPIKYGKTPTKKAKKFVSGF